VLPLSIISRTSAGKRRRRDEAFTSASDVELAALGATPEAITRLRQAQQKGRNSTSRAVAGLIDTLAPNSPHARAAVADLERQVAGNRRFTEEQLGNGKLPVVVEKDGGWTVYDPVSGQEIGSATSPEGAAAIVDEQVGLQEESVDMLHDGGSSDEGRKVGGRLSKLKERTELLRYKKWKIIAEKIHKSVSRDAATVPYDLGVKSKNKKGVDRSRILFDEECPLTPEEVEILDSPFEILLIHTGEGRLQTAILGKRDSVRIPDGTPAGSIITHNHPSGSGPGVEDIQITLENPDFVMRIVTRNPGGSMEIWQFSGMETLDPLQIEIITEYYIGMRDENGGKTIHGNRKALGLTMDKFPDILKLSNRIRQ
jgi:hypothetical protein